MSNFTDLIETKLSKPFKRVEVSGRYGLGETEFVGAVTNKGNCYHNVSPKYIGHGTSKCGTSKCGTLKMWGTWWFVTAEDVEENNVMCCKKCFPQKAVER